MSLPNCKKPCKDCPFRKDSLKGWLGEDRITEILQSSSFVCHKKTDLQCAGFMHIKGNESEFVGLAKMLGLDTKLTGKELIFENPVDGFLKKKSVVAGEVTSVGSLMSSNWQEMGTIFKENMFTIDQGDEFKVEMIFPCEYFSIKQIQNDPNALDLIIGNIQNLSIKFEV